MGAKRKISRGQVCAAFEHLVEVCQANVSIWCAHELSNKAMSRLFNSVELLRAETRDREQVVVAPEGSAEGMPLWHSSRPDFYLHRIVQRLDKVYDRLIAPAHGEAPALAAQLPPREQMPTEPTELVRFARQLRHLARPSGGDGSCPRLQGHPGPDQCGAAGPCPFAVAKATTPGAGPQHV
jgi:hypothetical protein